MKLLASFQLGLFAGTLLCGAAKAERGPGYSSVKLSTFNLNGKEYLLGSLSSRELRAGGPAEQQLAKNLSHVLEGWVKEQYVKAGVSPDFVDQLLIKEPLDDGRSELVFVTEKANPNNVKVTMRFSYVTPDHPLLPLEQRLNIRLPRPAPTRYENFHEGDGYAPLWKRGSSRPTGGPALRILNRVEIKTLIADKAAERDFLPLAWLYSETEIANPALFVDGTKSYRAENRLKPGNYVVETDDVRARLYRGLDFSPLEKPIRIPDPDNPGQFANVLSATREDYSYLGERRFPRRPGILLKLSDLSRIQEDHPPARPNHPIVDNWDPTSCAEVLRKLMR